MNRCFIYSAGTFYGLREQPRPGDFKIAADAGLLLCKKLGIEPDLIIGDFDSMPQPKDEPCVRVPVEKDDTDTMLALREGLAHGCTEFYFYGATGGRRLDHTLANLQSLAFLRRHGARGYAYDDSFVYTVIENEHLTVRQTVDWGLLSIFNLGADAEGLTLRGVQYELTDGTLGSAFPLGVSNHIIAPQADIDVRCGLLLVGWEVPPLSPSNV